MNTISSGGVQLKKTIRASGRVLCTCQTCKSYVVVDPLSHLTRPGRFVGHLEYKEHRQHDLGGRILQETGPPLVGPTPNILESDISPQRTQSRTTRRTSSGTSSKLTIMMQQVQSTLETRSVRGCVDASGLLFSTPPTFLSPPLPTHPDAYILKQGARANSRFLEHSNWLTEHRELLKRITRKLPFGENRLRAHVLDTAISRQLDEIVTVKQEEWVRQHLAAVEAGNDAIDTCTFIDLKLPIAANH